MTEEEKEKIRAAVQNAERKTSGEFITVLARRSDSYFFIPIIYAALCVMVVLVPLIYIFSFINTRLILDLQFLVFIVMYLIFQTESIKMKIVPKHMQNVRVFKLAMEQFLEQGVANTKDHSGVMFFVSMAERRVEIIADKGINEKVNKDAWQHIVDEFVENVRNDQMCPGFTTAIEKCGNLMAEHYPIQPDDKNELGDSLIEL